MALRRWCIILLRMLPCKGQGHLMLPIIRPDVVSAPHHKQQDGLACSAIRCGHEFLPAKCAWARCHCST